MSERLPLQMIGGLVVGLVLGVIAHLLLGGSAFLEGLVHYVVEPIGQIFLRLLFMLVIPLVISALALSVAELGDLRQLGRVGAKTFAYTIVVSTIAVGIGVGLVNLVQPGKGLPPDVMERLHAGAAAAPTSSSVGKSGVDFLIGLVPSNVVKAMSEGDMLALMVFAVIFGIGLAMTPGEPARRLEEVLRGLFEVTMRLLAMVIRAAPLGVACLVFVLATRLGLEVFRQLAVYVAVVLAGLALQQFVVYSASVAWLGGMSPRFFFRGAWAATLTAFSTASSSATLPTALYVAENELKLPTRVSRFVLTIGSTANQNGTALFEGVTVLFLAQVFGVDLTLGQQITVAFICILGGVGTAGVPAGSIPVVAMILGIVGVPPDGIAIVLGVDRLLDMCRTAVNVTGDLAAAVVVSRGEPAQG
ncbi:MAG TPA: dicarboxylate/amino acid:cation symporter [Myxococcota bacterium]|nr:dicarboxylate/amino acid:cation symporter [Myxococcota bacterium]